MKTKSRHYFFITALPLLSGMLNALGWLSDYLFLINFIALVPFFFVIDEIKQSGLTFFKKLISLLTAVALFGLLQLFIGHSWMLSVSAMALALLWIFNTFFLTITLSPILSKKLPVISFVFLYILHELLMQYILVLSPAYLLGYSIANTPSLIQYYAILGVEGGSLVILLVNFAVFDIIKNKRVKVIDYAFIFTFIFLTLFSVIRFYAVKDNLAWNKEKKVSIIHTEAEYGDTNYLQNPRILVDEVQAIAQENTLVIVPEGFFAALDWYSHLSQNTTLAYIDSLNREKKQGMLLGAMIFKATNTPTPQSRLWEGKHYNTHNVSILVNEDIRIKSKQYFIPFFEYVPNNPLAQTINKLIPVVGDERKINHLEVFNDFLYNKTKFGVLLCYGSTYPLWGASCAQNAQFMVIHANESWHHGSACSELYLNINRANTIQSGIPTYRASNYGYSAFIKPNGEAEVLYKTNKRFSSLIAPLPQNATPSFYTNIAGYSYYLSGMVLFSIFASAFFRKTNYNKPD